MFAVVWRKRVSLLSVHLRAEGSWRRCRRCRRHHCRMQCSFCWCRRRRRHRNTGVLLLHQRSHRGVGVQRLEVRHADRTVRITTQYVLHEHGPVIGLHALVARQTVEVVSVLLRRHPECNQRCRMYGIRRALVEDLPTSKRMFSVLHWHVHTLTYKRTRTLACNLHDSFNNCFKNIIAHTYYVKYIHL